MEEPTEVCFLSASGSDISVSLDNSSEDTTAFKSASVFRILDSAMQEDSDSAIEKARGIYCFKVKNKEGKEGSWIINAKTGKGSVTFNGKEKPDVTFVINDEDVIDLITGKLNPQKAYFQGKIKITGNVGLALKLTGLLKQAGKKIENLKSKL